jgi:hypothetical protein
MSSSSTPSAAAGRPSSRVLHAFLRNPLAISGVGLFGLTLLVALFAPALAPTPMTIRTSWGA